MRSFPIYIYIYINRFQRRNSFVIHGGIYSLITHSTLGLLAVEYSVAAELYTPRGPSTQIPLGGTVLQLSKLVNSEKISEGSIFYHFNTVIMSDASCNPIPHCCDQGLWRHNCLIIVRRFGFKLTNCIDFLDNGPQGTSSGHGQVFCIIFKITLFVENHSKIVVRRPHYFLLNES